MINFLPTEEYHSFYEGYIANVTTTDIVLGLQESQREFEGIMRAVTLEKLHYAYADKKWTVAEVIQHVLDTERIFNYRALCFARNDTTMLPGFEQDKYVPYSGASFVTKEVLYDF